MCSEVVYKILVFLAAVYGLSKVISRTDAAPCAAVSLKVLCFNCRIGKTLGRACVGLVGDSHVQSPFPLCYENAYGNFVYDKLVGFRIGNRLPASQQGPPVSLL